MPAGSARTAPVILKRRVENIRSQSIMPNLNPICLPVLVLALALFGLGFRFALKSVSPRALLAGTGVALAAAVPAGLFVAYYTHLFDRAIWFYEFRAVPCSELSAAGLGWTVGMMIGRLQRRVFPNCSRAFVGILWGLVVSHVKFCEFSQSQKHRKGAYKTSID